MSPPRCTFVPSSGPGRDRLEEIEAHLRAEGVLVYPTETVYGMGCLVRTGALDRLFRLKGRTRGKAVLLLVTEGVEVEGLRWTVEALELAGRFWPGPLTLVLPDPEGIYPPGVRSGDGGVAVRQSPHPLVRRIVARLREPLTSTSANLPGDVPARSGAEAFQVARDAGGEDEVWVLDSGPLPPSLPSTVVDCTGSAPVLRRRGAISSEEIFHAMDRTP